MTDGEVLLYRLPEKDTPAIFRLMSVDRWRFLIAGS
jgi:hypothetical protein